MLSALISFLGGSVFRMIWGEVSNYITKKQDHDNGLAVIKLQDEVNGNQFTRDLEKAKLLNDLGIKEIEANTEATLSVKDADAFTEAMKTINTKLDIAWVDAWNGSVRPLCATISVALWVVSLVHQNGAMSDWDHELVASIIGFFFADRAMVKRGK